MSFVASWGRPGVGILPLQHEGYDSKGWDLASRASMRAVRIKDRLDLPEGEGQWDGDLDSAGDMPQWLCWPNKQGGRQMPGWAQVWPAAIASGGGGDTPTPGGGGGGGGNNVPSVDGRIRMPNNPSVATDGASGPGGDGGSLGPSGGQQVNPNGNGAFSNGANGTIRPAPGVGGNPPMGPLGGASVNGGGSYSANNIDINPGFNPATGTPFFGGGFPQFSFNGSSSLASLSGIPGVGFHTQFAQFTFGGSNSLSALTGIPGIGFHTGFVQFIDPTSPPAGSRLPDAARNGMNVPITPGPLGGAPGPAGDPGLPGDPGASAAHSCGVFTGTHSVLPLNGEDMSPDSRYAPLQPKMPKADGMPAFPKGLFGLVVSATNEEKQIEYFFPSWTGQLIAVNQAGDARMGTLVCDLTSGSSIDKDRTAPLQSVFRIAKKPNGEGNAIGINISQSGCGDARGGYIGDKPVGGGGDDYGWGMASYLDKGPFCVGGKQDKHRKGLDADNNVVNALHFKTTALFHKDNVEDGPLRFEDVYHEGQDFAQYVKVHLAWSGEDWAWWTSAPFDLPTVHFDPIDPLTFKPLDGGDEKPSYPNFPIKPLDPTKPGYESYPLYHPLNEQRPAQTPGIVTPGSTSTGNVPIQPVHTSNVITAPGIASQPQNYNPGQLNSGTFAGAGQAGTAKGSSTNPVSGMMSGFAAQGGTTDGGGSSPPPGTGSQGDPWNYTTGPEGQNLGSGHNPFPSGTASGGWVIHPPETDLRDAKPYGMVPPNQAISTTYFMTAPGAWFGAGTPELVSGSIRSGYSWGMDSSTGDLLFRSHSFSETAVNAMRLTNTAQTIQWYATKTVYGELYHANTGNRRYTFPDVSGTVALTANVANGTFIYKSADESVTNSSALQDDNSLTMSVSASTKYGFRIVLFHTSSSVTAGIKLALNGTATITELKAQISIYASATSTLAAFARVTTLGASVGTNLANGDQYSVIEGSVNINAAGTFLLQWAQNSADALNATTVEKNSYIEVVQLT